ncbi:hypothetical protein [Thiocapsa sp.]|uniref:hypothetical protein n=1 Tax=Thiocapsa sp. TaxID=2024551 RepID=UPI0035942D23
MRKRFAHIGIDVNGITDMIAACSDDSVPTQVQSPVPIPACIIDPRFPGERPLGGPAAFESLHGRDWDDGHRLARHSIFKLLQLLETKSDQLAEAAGQSLDAGDLIATHLLALTQSMDGTRILAVPDTLSEMGQQRLLDGMRRLGIRTELLWRPVAMLLGWSCRQPDENIRRLHKTTVMVVHAGLWRPEVSVLELEVEESAGRPFLVPVRQGKGEAVRTSSWPIEQIARDLFTADLRRAGLPQSLAETQLWINRRPWSILCGQPAPDEIVRDQEGRWHKLTGQPELASNIEDGIFHPLLDVVKRCISDHRVDAALVEGPLVDLMLGDSTFGQVFAQEVKDWSKRAIVPFEVCASASCLPASGAAHYSWRQTTDIVGYYDTIPDLQINALVEMRPAFISLMKGRERVVGGKTVGMSVGGFSIAEGTNAVDYYLTRADEPTVRRTLTALPEPAQRTTPVTLVVEQTPGQGFASVEIRPPKGERLGDRAVFLDWSSMQDTGETPDQLIERLRKDYGMAFPDPAPFPCHAAVWKATEAVPAIQAFLADVDAGGQRASDAAERLMSVLGKKSSLDWLLLSRAGGGRKAGIFDSDGNIPANQALVQHVGAQPGKFSSYQELVDELLQATGRAFLRHMTRARDGDTDFHRRLLLIGGWCYAAAPEPILEYVRRSLQYGDTIHKKYDFNVAGRCFSRNEDISLLFSSVESDFSRRGIQTPFDRIKALSLVLSYRPDAPDALNAKLAYSLAEVAAAILEKEAKKCNIKKIFFAAAYLLMGLLRYRRVNAGFLDQERPENAELVARVKGTLKKAEGCVRGEQVDHVRVILKEITAFMEKRGTDALIFSKLDALSE